MYSHSLIESCYRLPDHAKQYAFFGGEGGGANSTVLSY